MTRTQVYLPDEEYKELQLLTLTGEDSFSDLIREGIRTVIKKKKKSKNNKKFDPWKDFIGKGPKGGSTDVSKNHDYYLYVEPYENKK